MRSGCHLRRRRLVRAIDAASGRAIVHLSAAEDGATERLDDHDGNERVEHRHRRYGDGQVGDEVEGHVGLDDLRRGAGEDAEYADDECDERKRCLRSTLKWN